MIKEEFNRLFSETRQDFVQDFELQLFTHDTLLKNRNEIPSLYRYSPADYYSIRGLETQSLFLTNNGNLNDVFEGLTCEINDKVLHDLDRLSNCAYIKSFSEEKSNLLMWAHYADNYCGMCVEYDFSKLDEAVLYHLFPVFYSNAKKAGMALEYTISELNDLQTANRERYFPDDTDFLKDIMHLFLTKSKIWEYEKEWRIIATYPQIYNCSDDIGDDIEEFYWLKSQTISVGNCIRAVYLGPRIKEIQRKHIIEICSQKLGGIPVYHASLSRDKYDLDFRLIESVDK